MQKISLLLTLAAVLLAASPAAADFKDSNLATGSDVLSYCAKDSASAQTACIGYIAGVSDAMISDLIRDTAAPVKACIPRKVTAGARAAIVIKWLSKHIERTSEPAAGLIVAALAKRFPCKRRKSK